MLFLSISVLITSMSAASETPSATVLREMRMESKATGGGDSGGIDLPEVDTLRVEGKDMVIEESVRTDSVIVKPEIRGLGPDSILIDSYAAIAVDSVTRRSPTVALFKSVVFPGWGQYSNRKYIKAILVFGVEIYLIYKAIDLGQEASDWKERWRAAPTELKSEYFRTYSDFRDRRNSHIWYTALTIFISMFDAYVDAHLAPFPKGIEKPEEVTLDMEAGEEWRLSLAYHF